MINHPPQRIITAIWFGVLGFLLIPFFAYTFKLTPNQLLVSTIISLISAIIAFFYGYKTLLQPANQLGPIITRATAAAWMGTIATPLMTFLINNNEPTPAKIIVTLCAIFIFMLIGIFYGYKLLNLPEVTFKKQYPTMSQRIISTLWFGLMGAITQLFFFPWLFNTNSFFVVVLTSYLGFAYGWRILLLPDSLKAALKSMVLGFIGSSFIVLCFAFLIGFFMVLMPTIGPTTIIVTPFIDALTRGIVVGVSVFVLGSLFACVSGITACVLLYLTTLIVRKAF